MCLIIKVSTYEEVEKLKSKPKIAKKDIKVWKVVVPTRNPNVFRSKYRNFRWQKGMHYYQTGRKFGISISDLWNEYRLRINRGLHAYTTKQEAISDCYNWRNEVVVEMIIPKGSEYYINKEQNEIVTDNLIFY